MLSEEYPDKKSAQLVLLLMIFATGFDILMTSFGIHKKGIGAEGNQVLLALMHIHPALAMVAKLALTGIIVFAMHVLLQRHKFRYAHYFACIFAIAVTVAGGLTWLL